MCFPTDGDILCDGDAARSAWTARTVCRLFIQRGAQVWVLTLTAIRRPQVRLAHKALPYLAISQHMHSSDPH